MAELRLVYQCVHHLCVSRIRFSAQSCYIFRSVCSTSDTKLRAFWTCLPKFASHMCYRERIILLTLPFKFNTFKRIKHKIKLTLSLPFVCTASLTYDACTQHATCAYSPNTPRQSDPWRQLHVLRDHPWLFLNQYSKFWQWKTPRLHPCLPSQEFFSELDLFSLASLLQRWF